VSLIIRILAEPRVIAVLLVTAAVALGWWHYSGLKSDLATARTELAAAQEQMRTAIEIANNNVAELRRAEEQHRAAIDALESAFEKLSAVQERAREAEQEVIAAPDDADAPVAPLLEDLRIKRFGGQR
jgi:Tfp pilus assembly protein PilO